MKKKKIIGLVSCGAFSALLIGTLASTVSPKQANAAAGDASTWGLVGEDGAEASIFSDNEWNLASKYLLTSTNNSLLHSWKQITFKGGEQFKATNGATWDGSEIGWDNTFGAAKEHFTYEGTNVKVVDAGTYDICVAWNGTWNSNAGANLIGLFPAGTLSNNITVGDKSIYVCELPNDGGYWDGSKIHAFGGVGQFRGFNDAAQTISGLTGYQSTAGVNLAGVYGNVKKVPYSSIMADDKFVLHNGYGYKSEDQTFVENAAYYFTGKTDKGLAILANNADLGSASAFILKAESYRKAVEEDNEKGILAQSICGMTQEQINTLVSEYAKLNVTAKGYVDATTITSYVKNGSGSYDADTTGSVSYRDIMEVLSAKVSPTKGFTLSEDYGKVNNYSLGFFVTITVASVLSVGGLFLLRKRKAE